MASVTDNHNLETPPRDTSGWDETWQLNFDEIERYLEVRDLEANRTEYTPHFNSKFFATDTGAVYLGDGEQWVEIQSGGGSVESLTANTVTANEQLTIPVADSTADLTGQQGSVAYLTGVDDPAGVYRHDGAEWSMLSGGGGDGTGVSELSGLTIDVSKNWQGMDITNVGQLSANRVTSTTDPVNADDVLRLGDVGSLVADHTHGDEAHDVEYASADHTHAGETIDPATVEAGSHSSDTEQTALSVVRDGVEVGVVDNANGNVGLRATDAANAAELRSPGGDGIVVGDGVVNTNTDLVVEGEVTATNMVTSDELSAYVSQDSPNITGTMTANGNDISGAGEVSASAVRASDGLTVPELDGVPEDDTNFYFRTDLA